MKEIKVDDEKVEAVELCYLGDMLSAGGGCELEPCIYMLQIGLGQIPTATSPPNQQQPATFDQR